MLMLVPDWLVRMSDEPITSVDPKSTMLRPVLLIITLCFGASSWPCWFEPFLVMQLHTPHTVCDAHSKLLALSGLWLLSC